MKDNLQIPANLFKLKNMQDYADFCTERFQSEATAR